MTNWYDKRHERIPGTPLSRLPIDFIDSMDTYLAEVLIAYDKVCEKLTEVVSGLVSSPLTCPHEFETKYNHNGNWEQCRLCGIRSIECYRKG